MTRTAQIRFRLFILIPSLNLDVHLGQYVDVVCVMACVCVCVCVCERVLMFSRACVLLVLVRSPLSVLLARPC